jgi:hypothetical protein
MVNRQHVKLDIIARCRYHPSRALVAQLVEQLICNQRVGGSSPSGGTNGFRGLTRFLISHGTFRVTSGVTKGRPPMKANVFGCNV